MILGCCNCSVPTALEAVRRVVPERDARVLTEGSRPTRHPVCVVPSVAVLRSVASALTGVCTVPLVVDSREELLTVAGMTVIDSLPGDEGWEPRPVRMAELRAALAQPPLPLGRLEFVPSPAVDALVAEACLRGVLGSVLAYAAALPTREDRDRLHSVVVDYLGGSINADALARRTDPPRAALRARHEVMCAALTGEGGRSLSQAIRLVLAGETKRAASDQTGADAFEISYCLFKMRMRDGARG